MKRIVLTAGLIGALAAAALSGCDTLRTASDSRFVQLAAEASVKRGVARFIVADEEAPVQRAERLQRIASKVAAGVGGGPEASIPMLAESANHEVGKLELSQLEREAATEMINFVAALLQDAVGDGVLQPDDRVKVAAVIGWVAEAAEAYLESRAPG